MGSIGDFTSDAGPGCLIIAGTGVTSISHFTLETDNYLKSAEKVFFLVPDPAIQAYIQRNNPNTSDLAEYYDEGRNRYESHLEMSEVILKDVRAGRKVFAIIYGHPAITASPAHMALSVARQEGYTAKMLPGISLQDCMLADLEIDPTNAGWTTCEATELLAHGRSLNTEVHNIILNIGNIGERQDNSKFHLLIDRLETDYGEDHRVLHYLPETLPQSSTAMVAYSIDEFRVEGLTRWIRPTSALYIPPLRAQELTTKTLELPDIALRYLRGTVRLEDTIQGTRAITHIDYGRYVEEAQARLSQHVPPQNYKSLHASTAMKEFMINLSLDPRLKERYKTSLKSRNTVIENVRGLTEPEGLVLKGGRIGPVLTVMLRSSDREPTKEELEMGNGDCEGESGHPIIAT